MLALQEQIGELSAPKAEKEIAEALGFILDGRRALLTTHLLPGYRESLVLVGRWGQELRRKGEELTEANGGLVLGLLKRVVD